MAEHTVRRRHCRFQDLTGKTFGSWLVLRETDKAGKDTRWICRCACGTEKPVSAQHLKSGKSESCGCSTRGAIGDFARTHGKCRTAEHRIWKLMHARCYNRNTPGYSNYGGRGIVICSRWRESFQNFLDDMGKRPTVGHSIDRIDNDGNYEPSNCRWATRTEQSVNQRRNHKLTLNGKTQTVSEWSREVGIKREALIARIGRLGWSVEKALTTPT